MISLVFLCFSIEFIRFSSESPWFYRIYENIHDNHHDSIEFMIIFIEFMSYTIEFTDYSWTNARNVGLHTNLTLTPWLSSSRRRVFDGRPWFVATQALLLMYVYCGERSPHSTHTPTKFYMLRKARTSASVLGRAVLHRACRPAFVWSSALWTMQACFVATLRL